MTFHEQEIIAGTKKEILRSEVYLRDKGVCWVCHQFVLLSDYELGHLLDRCNGGPDEYENLAVMHSRCNSAKPRHMSIEEATRWRNIYMLDPTAPRPKASPRGQLSFIQGQDLRPIAATSSTSAPQSLIDGGAGTLMPRPLHCNKCDHNWLSYGENQARACPNCHSRFWWSSKHRRPSIDTVDGIKITTQEQRERLYEVQSQRVKPLTVVWIQGRPMGGPMWKVLPPPYRQEDGFTMRRTPPGAIEKAGSGPRQTLQVIGGQLTQPITFDLGITIYTITPLDDGTLSISTTHSPDKSNTGHVSVGLGYGQIPPNEWREAKSQGVTFADFKRIARPGHSQA